MTQAAMLAGRQAVAACRLLRLDDAESLLSLLRCRPSPALQCADEKPGIVYAEMDFAQLAERRDNMPLRQQKRADLYALLDLTR